MTNIAAGPSRCLLHVKMKSMAPELALHIHIGSDGRVHVSMHTLGHVWKDVRAYEKESERG